MRPVEHRRGRQGNPDASRCLQRRSAVPPASARRGGAEFASAGTAPRGPCVRCGRAGSGALPRAARRGAPCSSNSACSSAGRGRSGRIAGPGQSTARKGTTGRNPPCATSGPSPRCWTDSSQRATLRAAPPSSARCRARRGRWPPSKEPSSRPTYFGIVVRCTSPRRPIRHRRGTSARPRTGVNTSPLNLIPSGPLDRAWVHARSGGASGAAWQGPSLKARSHRRIDTVTDRRSHTA